ncbi:MAG: transporter substrate-binding domain-containing protein [Alphaproteobacteria bacterium]|nr:transporter substrate-binding domain-containing protein [Alphaproteobacteria bacterium]
MRRRDILLGAGALLPALAAARAAPAGVPVLRVAYAADCAPFSAAGSNGDVDGALVRIVNAACTRAGIPALHVALPWERAQQSVRHGHADAFVTIATAERQLYASFGSAALLDTTPCVFYASTNAQAARLADCAAFADLRGLRRIDVVGCGYAADALGSHGVHWTASPSVALRAVAADRYDVFVWDRDAGMLALRRLGLLERVAAKPLPPAAAFRLGLRRTLPERDRLLAALDEAIATLKEAGEIAPIAAAPA